MKKLITVDERFARSLIRVFGKERDRLHEAIIATFDVRDTADLSEEHYKKLQEAIELLASVNYELKETKY